MSIRRQFKFSKKTKIFIIVVIVFLILMGIYNYHLKKQESRFWETQHIGNKIVKALDQYHSNHGQYPQDLEELTPQYLSEIKQPTWGLKNWIYEISIEDKDWFSLSVRPDKSNRPPLYYNKNDSGDGFWYYDDDAGPDEWIYD